jgi:chromosome segregation ATPase
MGWLELLPLLKRLLPLLTRVAPVLESFVAVKTSAREEIEQGFQRLSADMRKQLAAPSTDADDLKQLMAAHAVQLTRLREEFARLNEAQGKHERRLEEASEQIGVLTRELSRMAYLIAGLLVVCVVLLLLLLLKR